MVRHIFGIKRDRLGLAGSNPEDIGLQTAECHFVLLFDTHEAILGESNRDIGVFIRQSIKWQTICHETSGVSGTPLHEPGMLIFVCLILA